jgi:hypothetical protein
VVEERVIEGKVVVPLDQQNKHCPQQKRQANDDRKETGIRTLRDAREPASEGTSPSSL